MHKLKGMYENNAYPFLCKKIPQSGISTVDNLFGAMKGIRTVKQKAANRPYN